MSCSSCAVWCSSCTVFAQGVEQAFAEFLLQDDVGAGVGLDFVAQEFFEQLHREVLLRHGAHVFQKLFREQADVGLLQAGEGEDVFHAFGDDGVVEDAAEGGVFFGLGEFLVHRGVFHDGGFHRAEESDLGAQLLRLVERAAEGEGAGDGDDEVEETLPLSSLWVQNQHHLFRMLSRRTPTFICAAIACSA